MERKFQFSTGEFYHIYSRGVDKRDIFLEEKDKERFTKLLFVCNGSKPVIFKTIQRRSLDEIDKGETIVDIGAYCLMRNHFHLLIREKQDQGISTFLSKLLTAYSKYFNIKYGRTGALFESNFKAVHADNDEYLKYLFAYIHLNPIKIIEPDWRENGISDEKQTRDFLGEYKYSSYLDYIKLKDRPESAILEKSAFPEYFEHPSDFEGFIADWLNYPSSKDRLWTGEV